MGVTVSFEGVQSDVMEMIAADFLSIHKLQRL